MKERFMKKQPGAAASIFIVFLTLMAMLPNQLMSQSKSDNAAQAGKPLRLAVAGISHGHAPWIFQRKDKSDIIITGVYEPNKELAQRYIKQYGLKEELFHTDLNKMLDASRPEAVVAFGSIYEHAAAVEACAPRGIHVMVEKPLATTLEQAERMAMLAKKHGIYLLTNYETSWYPVTMHTYSLAVDSNRLGNIRKAVFHHGHQGPKEIGVNKEFFEWLTDPVQNGGGALVDFGCYGANIMTWMMKGEMPISVTAVTRQYKPSIYPKVDDEATILVNYENVQAIIQASWNWPFNRKDMEVYGERGYIITSDNENMVLRTARQNPEKMKVTTDQTGVYTDPFSYLKDVIRGTIKVPANGLYSLENNLMVVRILEAARESAKTGQTIRLVK